MNMFLITVLVFTALFTFVPMLIALIDILRNDFKGNDKIVWILVVLIFNCVGSILYFVIGSKQKIAKV